MARQPAKKPPRRSPPRKAPPAEPKEAIIDALLTLAAARDYDKIGLSAIAREAGLPLADMRELYESKFAIVTAFSHGFDRAVLGGGRAEGETARDRIFEILMRRFDALEAHKAAVKSIARAARRDICLGSALHRNAQRSIKWLMSAADVEKSGMLGFMALEGLVLVNGDALRTWLDDDDPGLARTMAALDRGLTRGESAINFVDRICSRFVDLTRRDRARRGAEPEAA
jgi:AcrR family transcriptional regulator